MKIIKTPPPITVKFENGKCEICENSVCSMQIHDIYYKGFNKGQIQGKKDGVLIGLKRHTWMQDGVIYVGNGSYTLKEAIEFLKHEGIL